MPKTRKKLLLVVLNKFLTKIYKLNTIRDFRVGHCTIKFDWNQFKKKYNIERRLKNDHNIKNTKKSKLDNTG